MTQATTILTRAGNERAFDWIQYSQDLSRLNMTTCARFSPPGSLIPGDPSAPSAKQTKTLADADALTLADGVMSYYLLLEPPQRPEECMQTLLQCSGSVARIGLTLWTTAQLQAILTHGREHLVPEDIQSVYDSAEFDHLRPLADGFTFRKPELFAHYPDVASAFYRKTWGLPAEKGAASQESAITPTQQPTKKKSGNKSGKSKFAAEKTREANADKERERLDKVLKNDDMRKDGLVSHALESLAQLREKSVKT